jgi:hypothetical protein
MILKTFRARPLALAALACIATASLAQEPNPFYVGASQALARDSNVFRVAGDAAPGPSADTISTTSLLAGLDQPIGRQRLFADAALRAVRHSENKLLDHTGGSLLAGLDWAAIDVLQGRLSYSYDRALARYGTDLGFTDPNTRVLQTAEEFVLRGQYGLVALLSVEGGFTRRKLDYSIPSTNAFEQDTVSAGLKFRPSGALTLGVGLRRTEGSYPVAVDAFDRDDIDLLAVWQPTGASSLTARLSRTQEDHQGVAARNVRGNTGLLSWNFKPTGKLGLTTLYVRDTGAETTFVATGGGATAVSSPLATTLQAEVEYQATAKIKGLLVARQVKRELAGADDKLTELRLGVDWSPLRSVTVGCSVGREDRDAATAVRTTLTRCLAQFRTQ